MRYPWQPKIKNYTVPPPDRKLGSFTIVPEPTQIVSADISNYKDALQLARGKYVQQRQTIYDIYQNALDFDSHLKGLIELRLLNTSGRVIEYVMNDEVYETDITAKPEFTKLVNDIIMTKFWGFGLFEFDKDLKYNKIPIKHIDQYQKMVRALQYSVSEKDKSYDKAKNAVFVGDPDSFGLLMQLSLLAMYKRAAMGDWSQYSQLAGTNFRVVKYRGTMPDAARRNSIRTIVNNAGAGTLDLPDDIDVETSNQTSSSQNQLFENYIAYLDEQMTKLVLGQTMTTEDGSSRSQAEVHERTQQSIFDSDAKFVIDTLNWDMYEQFDLPAGGKWRFAESNTGRQADELERDLKLKELGVIFTNEELRAKYQIDDTSNL